MKRITLVIGLALGSSAGLCGGGATGRCAEDAFGCDNGEPLVPDSDCTNDRELSVEVGDGAGGSFTALGPDEFPSVVYGPQGGQHTVLGVRVLEPDEAHPSMEIALQIEGCFEEPCEVVPEVVGSRTVTLGGDLGFPVTDGVLEQNELTMTFDVYGYTRMRLRVDVTDPCGRTGQAMHEAYPPS